MNKKKVKVEVEGEIEVEGEVGEVVEVTREEVVADLGEEVVAEIEKDAVLEESNHSSFTVLGADGRPIRAYSTLIHGKDAKKLANQFALKVNGTVI